MAGARVPASPHSVIGPLQLGMPLGIGLNEKHILVEMDASGSASEDGSLALGDQITSVDGVELSEETTFIDALDRNAATHTLVAVRLALTVGQEWHWVKKTTQLALPMGIGLDANNLVSPITQTRSASGSRLARMVTLTRCLARILILTPGERNHGGRQCDQGRHAPCGAPPRTLVPQTLSPPHALTPLAGRLSLCGVDGGSQGDQVVEVDGVDLRQGRASFLESLDQARSLSSACVLASPLPPPLPPPLPRPRPTAPLDHPLAPLDHPPTLGSHAGACGRSRDSSTP